MQMNNRVPEWLTPVAWLFITLALLGALTIAADIYLRQRRRDTVAEELVWITSALYLGPFALLVYARHRRSMSGPSLVEVASRVDRPSAVAGLPGGSASAVGHLIGVPLVIASGLTIAGISLWVMIIVIAFLAIGLLFAYERLASHRGVDAALPLGAAVAAAALTVVAFDIGMGGWMLLLHFNEFMPPASDGSFWFLMQVGIVLGILTGYPAVAWLAKRNLTVVPV